MTINEQLWEAIDDSSELAYNNTEWLVNKDKAADSCESIVEDIAIQFLSWVNSKNDFEWSNTYRFKNDKELFQIFKQEKGL